MQNLNIHYLYLYTTSNRIQCLNTKNTIHILLCKKNNSNIYQSLINIINNSLTSLKIITITASTFLNILLYSTPNSPNPQYDYILFAISGIFILTTITNIKALVQKQTELLLINLSNNLLN